MKRFIETYTLLFTAVFVIIFLLMLAFQGVDVCDEGWYMTFYQQIFHAPETVEYNFVFWLTGIVGGLWYELFPNGGILSFRILAIVCLIATMLLSYKIFIQYLSKPILIVSLLIVLIVNDFGYLSFYYNHLSAFLVLLAVFFVLKGLNKNKYYYLILAGFITAINVFSRLPNVTLFAIVLVFPVQWFWNRSLKFNRVIKQFLAFGIGVCVGFALVGLIMYSLGHIDVMEKAIQGLFNKSVNSDSNHNLSKLFSTYKGNYFNVLKSGIKLSVVLLVFIIIQNKLKLRQPLKILLYIFIGILIGLIFKREAIFTLYFLGLTGIFGVLFFKHFDYLIKTIAFLALIILVLLPLGSDGGIDNVGYVSIWLALPFCFIFCLEIKDIKSRFFLLEKYIRFLGNGSTLKRGLIVMVFAYFFIKIYNISNHAYFDPGSRLEKTYAIHADLAKGVYTTKKRAYIINDILLKLKDYVKEGDYLLAYDNIPMLNYLTKTKPYMYISWVWVYDSETFRKQLIRAEKEIASLPIVVQQKFQTIGDFSEPVLDYMLEDRSEDYIYKSGRTKAMNAFLKRNNYEIVWSNDYFNILKVGKN